MAKLRELLNTSAESDIIESEIYSILVNAVQETLVGTQLLALRIGPQSIPGSSFSIPLATKDAILVHAVSEGAEIPIETEAYSTFTLTPVKYGVRPLITKEMLEDSKFDLIERQIRESGYQMAKKLDSLIMATIEAGSTAASQNVTTVGVALTIGQITEAIQNLEGEAFRATDIILSAACANDVRNIDTFTEADKAGITNPGVGLIGVIFGMKVWQSNQVTANKAYILDRNDALALAEKRPLTINKYDDVTRDMTGLAVTARWHTRYLRENAISVITTS